MSFQIALKGVEAVFSDVASELDKETLMSAAIATFVPADANLKSQSSAPSLALAAESPAPPISERRREDRALVESILSGEAGSFERLHELYAHRLYRFAVKRLGDSSEAEDVVQDTLLEVHRCLASWEGRSTLLTWMFGIAHHQLCRRFRKKSPLAVPNEQLEAYSAVLSEWPSEGRIDANRILDVCAETLDQEVSPAQREIFDLYYGKCLATKEIAKDLGKSNQAVKISLFRTRRAMEARLEEGGLAVTA